MDIKNTSRFITAAVVTMFSVTLLVTNNAFAVAKCQDADGKWHYGTSVSSKCAQSEITKLNDRGVVKEKVAAPKTDKELAAEKANAEAEEKKRLVEKEENDHKNRILSIYETEEDIERIRQNNLRSLNQQMVLHNAYANSLKENQVLKRKKSTETSNVALRKKLIKEAGEMDAEIAESKQSSLKIAEKIKLVNIEYDQELELFRKYTAESK